jgi:hypothetical protein
MKLKCIKGKLRGQSFELSETSPTRLGREPEASEAESIILTSANVSANHAEVGYEDNSFIIKDLKSRNGIRVNKQKVISAFLSPGDEIDIGDFRFVVESDETTEEGWQDENEISQTPYQLQSDDIVESTATQNEEGASTRSGEKQKLKEQLKQQFDKLDFSKKLYGGLGLLAILIHFLIVTPLEQEAKKRLFKESFQSARQVTENLAQRYRQELGEERFHEIDCDVYRNALLRNNLSVPGLKIISVEKEVICPLGEQLKKTYFLENAFQQNKLIDDCEYLINYEGEASCTIISPVRYKAEADTASQLVGYALLEYAPLDVYTAMDRLKSLKWQTFWVCLIALLAFGYLIQRLLKGAVSKLTDEVHLLHTGTAQKVENLPNFAGFNALVEEINGLIAKSDQAHSSGSGDGRAEASFLQIILEQVLLLEERAVMAVDNENHVLGISETLAELIPLHENYLNSHVTEAIADTHLQAELMSFLNDINYGSDMLERSLSLSDRVIHSRGMPLFMNEECVGALVFFDFD